MSEVAKAVEWVGGVARVTGLAARVAGFGEVSVRHRCEADPVPDQSEAMAKMDLDCTVSTDPPPAGEVSARAVSCAQRLEPVACWTERGLEDEVSLAQGVGGIAHGRLILRWLGSDEVSVAQGSVLSLSFDRTVRSNRLGSGVDSREASDLRGRCGAGRSGPGQRRDFRRGRGVGGRLQPGGRRATIKKMPPPSPLLAVPRRGSGSPARRRPETRR